MKSFKQFIIEQSDLIGPHEGWDEENQGNINNPWDEDWGWLWDPYFDPMEQWNKENPDAKLPPWSVPKSTVNDREEKPVDMPEPPSQWPWDQDEDEDGIPDNQDPDPLNPDNPSFTNPHDPYHDPKQDRPPEWYEIL